MSEKKARKVGSKSKDMTKRITRSEAMLEPQGRRTGLFTAEGFSAGSLGRVVKIHFLWL